MRARMLALVLVIALATVAGCTAPGTDEEPPEVTTPDADSPSDDGASGLRLANGLYELEDGRVQAIGTLEYVDLEGGFYALTGAPEGGGNIAVIANPDEFADELVALKGKTVSIVGTRYDGASIRMAGPEVTIETIEEISDTPGAAE